MNMGERLIIGMAILYSLYLILGLWALKRWVRAQKVENKPLHGRDP
ncbi:MAG: hypothetical protein Q8P45_02620 [Candidatus Harrisonbacteria bacterium]|nr:hypothetical protein [Candidatus Harrisonbacteria bacterium]